MYLAPQLILMKYLKYYLSIFLISALLSSCSKDSGPEPIRDLQEQTLDDDQALVDYLKTHFYNYQDFQNEPDNFKIKIEIDSLDGENADKTALWDQVESKEILVSDMNNNDVSTKMYYLVAKTGIGENPSTVDSTFVTYKGELLNGSVFDKKEVPIWFNLASGVIRGFKEFLPQLKAGDHLTYPDGTYEFDHYGQGILFIPSSLGYFSQSTGIIPSYSPLVFSVALHKVNIADHDNDGILSRDEDPDGDGNPLNDDTDEDRIPNYLDSDDDNDGTDTKIEFDRDGDGVFDDDDNDGTPDYLDANST